MAHPEVTPDPFVDTGFILLTAAVVYWIIGTLGKANEFRTEVVRRANL